MLTVKHVHASGNESIHVAREVRFDRGAAPDSITDAPTLWIDTPTGDTQALGSFGTFFVMNDAGRTIARYNLGGVVAPGPIVPGADHFSPATHAGIVGGVA